MATLQGEDIVTCDVVNMIRWFQRGWWSCDYTMWFGVDTVELMDSPLKRAEVRVNLGYMCWCIIARFIHETTGALTYENLSYQIIATATRETPKTMPSPKLHCLQPVKWRQNRDVRPCDVQNVAPETHLVDDDMLPKRSTFGRSFTGRFWTTWNPHVDVPCST